MIEFFMNILQEILHSFKSKYSATIILILYYILILFVNNYKDYQSLKLNIIKI